MIIKQYLSLGVIALWAEAYLMVMEPEPYGKDSLNNSPLAADGSDFPCKLRPGAFEISGEATYRIGDDQVLKLEGSITHGGGSCQICLTEDRVPTKDSEWKVIKSFEGGCPANVKGQLVGGADSDNSLHLGFRIPEGIVPGQYTLAWTWFNRIGNREMYMNCAPITVIGNNQSVMAGEPNASFPPMFIANINGCNTTEMVAIRFPEPGNFVETPSDVISLASEDAPPCTGILTLHHGLNTKVTSAAASSEHSTAIITSTTLLAADPCVSNCSCRYNSHM
ncbi:hypothetical protein N7539_006029 [Penicillium diatomitis]|uniref:Lytic polysaccharide monooxygenase n=1 Tax=Penicillium diatomitis TaxID=2819901 RepID=A0A9W9X5X4_9EURO|nr:uncharacterized protein N7539_006029 [Penicillium diatomitis]KAJ5483829.1 hypothetical protein N7539_006029 [Penicillium diatomitis]